MFTHFYEDYKGNMIKKLLLGILFTASAYAAPLDSRVISVTPTVDTSIYASGDVVGGKMTFTGALSSWTGSGILTGAVVTDKAATSSDLELWLFDQDPSGFYRSRCGPNESYCRDLVW